MKTKLDPNGWTVHIDEDIRFLSDEQIKEVCRYMFENLNESINVCQIYYIFSSEGFGKPYDRLATCGKSGFLTNILFKSQWRFM